ncbi:hypothetical protein SNEBB_003009 [Seison nebaliae]|nr:hypothetical protein SNEBB_003009 [Seison nebaliae]
MTYLDRREALKELYVNSNKKLVGFYNDLNLGVCITNSLLSIILSSDYLMHRIHEDMKHNFYNESYVAEIRKNPCTSTCVPRGSISSAQILRVGMSKIKGCELYAAPLGVSGDYFLLKYYNSPYVSYRRESCREIILRCKDAVSGYERFDAILTELFEEKFGDYMVHPFQVSWYPKLQFLNLNYWIYDQVNRVGKGLWDTKRISTQIFQDLTEREIFGINRRFKTEKIETPQFICIYMAQSYLPEIHPSFYVYLTQTLGEMFDNNIKPSLNNLNNFPVYYVEKGVKLPNSLTEDNLKYEFPFDITQNHDYSIRTIVLHMMDELFFYLEPVIRRCNPEIQTFLSRECTMMNIAKLENYMTDVTSEEFQNYLPNYSNLIMETVTCVCNHIENSKDNPNFFPMLMGLHALALVRKEENQWILMNDDLPFVIEDIDKFRSFLRNEKVALLFFEKSDIMSTTTTTIIKNSNNLPSMFNNLDISRN